MLMAPIDKKTKNAIATRIQISIKKVLEAPELAELSEDQIELIAKSCYIDSLKTAFAKEVQKAKLDNNAVDELVKQWLSGFQSFHTIRSFKKNIELFLIWLNGTSLLDVDANVADKYISYLNSQKKKTKKEPSDNTIRQRIAACSSFFTDLVRWGVVPLNPFKGAKGLPKKKIVVKDADKIPTDEELDILEEFALKQSSIPSKKAGKAKQNKLIGNKLAFLALHILRKYGLRVGALKTLKVDREGNFRVESKGNEIHGKFDDVTIIMFTSFGRSMKNPFEGYTESAFSMWLRRAQESPELVGNLKGKYSPHSILHRFAINFYNETHDVEELRKRLGHSSLLVTTAYLAGLRINT